MAVPQEIAIQTENLQTEKTRFDATRFLTLTRRKDMVQAGRVWKELLSVAKKLGLPRSYQRDLTKWDKEALSKKDESEAFVWVLYDCGTHLINNESKIIETFREVLQTCFTIDRHCFLWNGKRLVEYQTADLALDALDSK